MNICFLLLCFQQPLFAQEPSRESDTLQHVIVEAFASKVQWKTSPVAIASLSKTDLQRFAPVSMVPVLNLIPGVRMEERSPGSYRLSIRGSLLRSPFGVRNLKIYWNQIPLSDATGNTYLNLMEPSDLDAINLLKGPSASVYGAGTGGVLLLKSLNEYSSISKDPISLGCSIGAYGQMQESMGWLHQGPKFSGNLQQSYIKSDGYRDQSAMEKKHVKYSASIQFQKHQIGLLAFYSNLFYQTPGGITLLQMQTNPRLSRQATATLPSAITQNASISNKTIFAGVSDQWQISHQSNLKGFVSVNNTQFENPFITNYEFRNETNTATGLQWQWFSKNKQMEWVNGGEWLFNHSIIADYGNRKGIVDTVQFKDNIHANQWSLFSQFQWHPSNFWQVQVGVSWNNQSVNFLRLTDIPQANTHKSTSPVLAPRIGITYQIFKEVAVYAIASYGFSPPSLAEIRPSDGKFYAELEPEFGWNKEIGIKGYLCKNQLQFDLAYYHFNLQQAIVRRNNTAGAEYFVNAGSTLQQGMEAMLKYSVLDKTKTRKWTLDAYSSIAFQPYQFLEYQQGSVNYNGNALTGVPRNTWVSGFQVEYLKKFYLNANINMVDPIPLTDANDAIADPYQLVQLKSGFKTKSGNWLIHIYGGIDNLLNQPYSLGNDINAAGKRYYNPAATRNFYLGFNLQFH